MDNPFSWDYMTTVPDTDQVFGPFAVVYLILFGLGFLVSVFLYNDGARRYIDHSLKRRILRRGAGIAMIVFGAGLFFFGIRVLQINPFTFGMRIWLWLSFLAALIMAAYFAYYLRVKYPPQLRAYEERRRKQQYLRPSPAAAVAGARATVPRSPSPQPRRPARRRR